MRTALFSLLMLMTPAAQAITIDTFETDAMVASTSTVGSTQSTHVASSGATGGGRTFTAMKLGAGTGVSRLEVVDSALGYTQGAHSGQGVVTWDGNSDSSTVKADGLGSIDLTQDGGTEFRLGLQFFDYPFNQSVDLRLRLYDARFADGSVFSEVSISLNQYYDDSSPFIIAIPFSIFASAGTTTVPAPQGLTFAAQTSVGTGGGVDVRYVGAIQLAFHGELNSKAPDLIITPFTTDGRCLAVPNSSGRAMDDCSVCLELPEATNAKDPCGVCLNGPPGYSYASNTIFDSCNLCPGDSTYQYPDGKKDACGTCLGGPAPYQYKDIRDACGTCGGKAQDASECSSSTQQCKMVKPPKKILDFEKRLVQKANLLKQRFLGDVRRSQWRKCGIDFSLATKRVSKAFGAISNKATDTFRRGVKVCGKSCVTVSYAREVKSLAPQFKVLEDEAMLSVQKVRQCYRDKGIVNPPSKGKKQTTDQTIKDVRQGLGSLISECQKTKVCS